MDFTTGQIIVSALDFVPTGTFACNGQLLSVSANMPLFKWLGNTYGGDGTTTFAVPDIPVSRFGPDGPPVGYYMVANAAPYQSGMDALLGEVRLLPVTPPAGSTLAQTWLPCDGRLIALDNQSDALFSLVGTVYGGDGIKTFGLPNLAHVTVSKGPPLPYWICISGQYPSDSGDSVTPKYAGYALDAYIGTVVQLPYASSIIDRIPGLALCLGQTLPIADPWVVLFSLLGIRFGGNGTTTFKLPTLPSAPTGPGIVICELIIEGLYPPRS
jgi:microcystin-dependent protein